MTTVGKLAPTTGPALGRRSRTTVPPFPRRWKALEKAAEFVGEGIDPGSLHLEARCGGEPPNLEAVVRVTSPGGLYADHLVDRVEVCALQLYKDAMAHLLTGAMEATQSLLSRKIPSDTLLLPSHIARFFFAGNYDRLLGLRIIQTSLEEVYVLSEPRFGCFVRASFLEAP